MVKIVKNVLFGAHFFYFSSNNSGMQWYFIVLITLSSVTVLLLLPLVIKSTIYLNAKENLGVVMVSLWGIPVVCFQVKLQKAAITIIKRRGEEKEVPLKVLDPNVIFAEYFAKAIFRFIVITNLSAFMTVAKRNDAFVPSLAGGAFLNAMYMFFAFLYTKKGEVPAFLGVDTASDKDELSLLVHGGIIITPLVIIAGALRAKKLTKRWFSWYERLCRQHKKSDSAVG